MEMIIPGTKLKNHFHRLRCVRRVDDLILQALLDGESKEESVDARELISKVEQIFKEALAKLEEL